MSSPAQRFPCSPGGAIARSRRLLGWLLLGLAFGMLGVALVVWLVADRPGPAVLAVLLGLVAWTSWRMSGDLDPLWLERLDDRLVLQLRRQRHVVPLLAPRARLLTEDERKYLAVLVSSGPWTAGTGGFDSHRLGEFNLYASNLQRPVLLDTGESRLVLTPDDPDAFLRSIGGEGIG